MELSIDLKSSDINVNSYLPDLLPIEKSFHQELVDVKTTIIKIFVNRGFIELSNKESQIQKLISDDNDDMEYTINLDRNENYNTLISNKKVHIKIFDYKIASVNKTSPIGEFLTKYNNEYKFLVVYDINPKSEKNILDAYSPNIEIFKFSKLKSDITEHDMVPQHIVMGKEEGEAVMETYRARKRDMPLIKTTDPVAKYYNMKPGEIVKIIRPSPITCYSIGYRFVIKSKDNRAKT